MWPLQLHFAKALGRSVEQMNHGLTLARNIRAVQEDLGRLVKPCGGVIGRRRLCLTCAYGRIADLGLVA
jgi:hypothetical protein